MAWAPGPLQSCSAELPCELIYTQYTPSCGNSLSAGWFILSVSEQVWELTLFLH